MNKHKTIGVLGGMGPSASANLYMKILHYAQTAYGAVQDSDYPPIIIYSLPLVGFTEKGIEDEKVVKKQLIEGVKKLEDAGCDLIVIACNTVHIFYQEMQGALRVPLLNIVEETKKKVLESGYKKVGLFASESMSQSGLYQRMFAAANIEVISPKSEQQKIMNRVIEHVMGGNQKEEDIIALKNIAREYVRFGAEAIVLGCTEIPLAINQCHTDIKLFDTIEILVQAGVDFSLQSNFESF